MSTFVGFPALFCRLLSELASSCFSTLTTISVHFIFNAVTEAALSVCSLPSSSTIILASLRKEQSCDHRDLAQEIFASLHTTTASHQQV